VSNQYELDRDWEPAGGDREWAETELLREVFPGHLLFGVRATAIARRWRRDDFLFRLEDGRFAQVHLTRHVETDPRWPGAEIYKTFEDWKAVPVEDR
jgi:hypothetical protein